MAIPPTVLGAAISSGGNIISDIANNVATATQNRKSRQFTREIRAEDRKWALEDWARQNEYNSPANQRKLLEEGNFNPALMYGGGGNITAASEVRSTDTKMPEFRPASFQGINGVTSFLATMYDLEAKKQTVDNLKAQNTKTLEESAYIAAQRENTTVETLRRRFDLDLESELRETSAEYRKGQVRNLAANTQMTLDENTRKEIQNYTSLAAQAEHIMTMQAQRAKTNQETQQIKSAMNLMKKDSRLKDLEIALREEGLNPNDPTWMRVLTMYVKSMLNGASVLGSFNPFKKK